jgi:membrane protein
MDGLSNAVAISRVPERLRPLTRWMIARWPGRVVLGGLAGFGRLELFDRAMALAAQLFTSVFPVLIMLSVWVGQPTSDGLADAVSMPSVSQDVLDQALDESGGTAFGLLGTLLVLASATSLSRALARAMATVWRLPRPKTRLTDAWRWVAVVMALALSVALARTLGGFTDALPPRDTWTLVITFALDIFSAAFVPWLLLASQVPVRRLLPGAIVFALAMLVARPASEAYLPRALEESADRYGTIGVAFTYLAWLYVASFIFLAAAVLGNVIAEDRGRLGQLIRGGVPTRTGEPSYSGERGQSV